MQKPFIFVLTIFAVGVIFFSPAEAQQIPASSAPQTPPAAATQAKPSAKATPQAPATAAKKPASAKAPAVLTLKTPKDKVSYAIGMNIGKSLKRDSVDVDPAILLRAIKDVAGNGKLLLTDQEAQAALTALQEDLRQKLADTNKKEGDAFLAANKTKEGVVSLPSGLQYKILQEGAGPKPVATDTVTVNYRATLLSGSEFDSSSKRGQPATFPVGQIIKGWTEALQLMPVGSKWQLFIPSDLAYGPPGRPPMIGPNSTLVFEVELLSIQPKPAAASAAALLRLPRLPQPRRPPLRQLRHLLQSPRRILRRDHRQIRGLPQRQSPRVRALRKDIALENLAPRK